MESEACILRFRSSVRASIRRHSEGEVGLKLNLQIRTVREITVIECRGRIAYRMEAAALGKKVAELLHNGRQLVIDLSGVEMIDSAGLGELVRTLTAVQSQRGSVKLASPSQQVRSLLELTNLNRVLAIHPSVDEALLASIGQVA